MYIQILCINKDGGNHNNPYLGITNLGWKNINTGTRGNASRKEMIEFIEKNPNSVFVASTRSYKQAICIVKGSGSEKYVTTKADNLETNNLLELVECKL